MRRRSMLAVLAGTALAVAGCAGADVENTGPQEESMAVEIGSATWHLPRTVTLTPKPSSTASPPPDGLDAASLAWTHEGAGLWGETRVRVFARALSDERFALEVTGKLRAVAQIGGIPSFSSLAQSEANVRGASTAQTVLFSYSGDQGSGQGMWLAAVQSRTRQGIVVQVATTDTNIEPSLIQAVADSVELSAS